MIGMFGCISKNNLKEEQYILRNKIISSLVIAMQSRGEDITGLSSINGLKVHNLRKKIPGSKLIYQEEYKKFLLTNPPILIGATSVDNEICDIGEEQPIDVGYGSRVIGTFDGWILNRGDLYKESKTDAQAIIKSLWIKDNDYQKLFQEAEGNKTLVWYFIKNPDRIFLLRNGENIYFSTVRELKTTFYCSSRFALESILTATLSQKHIIAKPEKNNVYTITQRAAIAKEQLRGTSYSNIYTEEDEENFHDDLNDYKDVNNNDILEMDKGILAGCKKCKKTIVNDSSFYWNEIKKEVRCVICGGKSRPKLDWIKLTDKDYIEMVEQTNWNFAFI